MENNEDKKIILKTISIKDLWNVLRGCWMFMLVIAIVVSVVGYLYGKSNYVPMYSSSATLYLLGTNEGGEVGGEIDEEDKGQWTVNYTLANVVIDDSIYLLTSRTVLNQLGDELGVANGYGAFKSGITIANPEGTRVLEVKAVASSPELAKGIVDALSISLNAPDRERYDQICKSVFGPDAFEGLLDFATKAKAYVPSVTLSIVDKDLSEEEINSCRRIAENCGVNLRIREYIE